jgi:hypothetical protein
LKETIAVGGLNKTILAAVAGTEESKLISSSRRSEDFNALVLPPAEVAEEFFSMF